MEFGPFAIDREIELLVQAGCGVAEAIGAATGASATALGIGNDTGTLETGKFADLVVLASDPEADIRAIGQVVAVVAGGERWAAAAVDHALPRSASASG
jgi:imidazolonepropionase-like amidohydrolase